jgi:GT2 family glycosyltransferase
MITYVLPTRNRPGMLRRSLGAIGALPRHDAEVVVVDNASDVPPAVPIRLDNGIDVRLLFRETNEGAAARNAGVAVSDPAREWVVMLDDDSYPLDCGHLRVLREQPSDVAAVGAEIFLPCDVSGVARREAGGLPEVFTGCGVAIRRAAFLGAGGYDASFQYYVEEYDLAAKLLLRGWRVVHDRRFRVMHEKTPGGRDMNVILRRLVRNNAWVVERYAPADARREERREVLARYAAIAAKERALAGYTAGMAEALATLRRQERTPMPAAMFDRFTGLAEARRSFRAAHGEEAFATAAVVDEGKNARLVRRALEEVGVRLAGERDADVLAIGTLSPGPMLDAWERRVASGGRRVVVPWADLIGAGARRVGGAPVPVAA